MPAPGGRFELEHRQARRDHLPPAPPSRVREPGAREFIHSLSDLLGGICRAGFVIEDLGEPDHTRPAALPGSFADRASFLPPYLRVLARRAGPGAAAGPGLLLQQGIVMPQGSPPPPGALP